MYFELEFFLRDFSIRETAFQYENAFAKIVVPPAVIFPNQM